MLNTFHLRTFLAVVDAGSYSAAAKLMHMSQPAVSQQIRALEEQLGDVRLFRRVGQRMVPTHVGEELLPSARDLVGLAERAEQNIIAMRGQITGRVAVGCTLNSGERAFARLLSAFHAQYPAVTLELRLGPVDELLDALNDRDLALLLIEEQQRRRGFESHMLGSEALALVAPSGHPLLQHTQLPPGTLREHPLVLPRLGTPLRRAIDEGLRRRSLPGADLRVALEAESVTALFEAACAGLGLAFVPRSCLPARSDGFGTIDLAGQPIQQDWYLLRARERSFPRASQALYDFLTGLHGRSILTKIGLSLAET